MPLYIFILHEYWFLVIRDAVQYEFRLRVVNWEHLPTLAATIQPALDKARDKHGDLVRNTMVVNAKMVTEMVTEQLKSSVLILSGLTGVDRLKVVAEYYDLTTGTVEMVK